MKRILIFVFVALIIFTATGCNSEKIGSISFSLPDTYKESNFIVLSDGSKEKITKDDDVLAYNKFDKVEKVGRLEVWNSKVNTNAKKAMNSFIGLYNDPYDPYIINAKVSEVQIDDIYGKMISFKDIENNEDGEYNIKVYLIISKKEAIIFAFSSDNKIDKDEVMKILETVKV